jgi:hypothetical protein
MVSLIIYLIAVGLALFAAILLLLIVIVSIGNVVFRRPFISDNNYYPLLVGSAVFCAFESSLLLLDAARNHFDQPPWLAFLINISNTIDILLLSLFALFVAIAPTSATQQSALPPRRRSSALAEMVSMQRERRLGQRAEIVVRALRYPAYPS